MIIAIDPGTTKSAIVEYERGNIEYAGILENDEALATIRYWAYYIGGNPLPTLVIEQVASYGMAVGAEVFETVYWSGRFCEAWACRGGLVERLPRQAVKMHLCHDSRAKDANIRQALIDKFGGKQETKKGGRLHGIKDDLWAALAVAVTWEEGGR